MAGVYFYFLLFCSIHVETKDRNCIGIGGVTLLTNPRPMQIYVLSAYPSDTEADHAWIICVEFFVVLILRSYQSPESLVTIVLFENGKMLGLLLFLLMRFLVRTFVLLLLLDVGTFFLDVIENVLSRLRGTGRVTTSQRIVFILLLVDAFQPGISREKSMDLDETPIAILSYEQRSFSIEAPFEDLRNMEHSSVRRMLLLMSGIERWAIVRSENDCDHMKKSLKCSFTLACTYAFADTHTRSNTHADFDPHWILNDEQIGEQIKMSTCGGKQTNRQMNLKSTGATFKQACIHWVSATYFLLCPQYIKNIVRCLYVVLCISRRHPGPCSVSTSDYLPRWLVVIISLEVKQY